MDREGTDLTNINQPINTVIYPALRRASPGSMSQTPLCLCNCNSWQKATDAPEPVLKKRMEHIQLQGVSSKFSKAEFWLLKKETDKGDTNRRNKLAFITGLRRGWVFYPKTPYQKFSARQETNQKPGKN